MSFLLNPFLYVSAPIYAMRIATSTTSTNLCYFDSSNTIVSGKTVIIEAKLKIETSGSNGSQVIVVGNGTKYVVLLIGATSIKCNYNGTSSYTYAMDGTVDHIYKLKLNGTTNCEFYVDDVLVHTAIYANFIAASFWKIEFGDGYSEVGTGGSGIWKSFRYNVDYTTNPTNFVEWNPVSLPSSQGWTAGGTTSLATIITE